jgi:hypothetical protein
MAWSPRLIDPDRPLGRTAPCRARRRDDWQPQVGLPRPGHRPWIPTRPATSSRSPGTQPAPSSASTSLHRPAAASRPSGRFAGGPRPRLDPTALTRRVHQQAEEDQEHRPATQEALDRPRSFRDDLLRRAAGECLVSFFNRLPRSTLTRVLLSAPVVVCSSCLFRWSTLTGVPWSTLTGVAELTRVVAPSPGPSKCSTVTSDVPGRGMAVMAPTRFSSLRCRWTVLTDQCNALPVSTSPTRTRPSPS